MDREALTRGRFFLKDTIRKRIDFSRTDQHRGVPPPPLEKPVPAGATVVELPRPGEWRGVGAFDVAAAIGNRRSRRAWRDAPLSLDEVSFLLWATQGLRRQLDAGHATRTVPSAGCRHALETQLVALAVDGLAPGVYRYLPLSHRLFLEFTEDGLAENLTAATLGQAFVGGAPATFVWSTVAYRMEWRYGAAAHKVIALDAGHVCQNLYLACEAIGAGTCAVAAYDQEAIDRLLRLDGEEEFVVYLAPAGKVG